MMDKIVIYKSQKKALIIIVSSVLVLLFGNWMLQNTEKEVIGWSLIIFSFLMLILGFGTLFDRRPKIILTTRGITETSVVREEIEWDAIQQVNEFFFRGQYFVGLLVNRNYKPDLIFPIWFHRLDRIYASAGLKGIFIRVSLLDINSVLLTQIIRKMVSADNREESLKSFKL